jgi:fatty acid amide hydrolase 2
MCSSYSDKTHKTLEVMQAYIQRVQEVNPIVNAVIADRYADAMSEAQEVDNILDNKKGQGKYSAIAW